MKRTKTTYQNLMDAADAYAMETGDRVQIKIRPQKGVKDRVRVEADINPAVIGPRPRIPK